ncbi:MAG: AAA domain-containing protein [Flavobacteriales bacterium]
MQKPSADLLLNLESKLKSANIRSPYLRATIGRSRGRVDLHSLNLLTETKDFAQIFLNKLTEEDQSGVLELEVRIQSAWASKCSEEERFQMDVLMQRMHHIHFDQEEDFLEHGTRSFGFGYPLIALRSKQDRKKVILAPLFIWSLDIQPLANNHHAFTISRNEEHAIVMNPQLSAFLQQDYGYVLEHIPDQFLENDCLSKEEISKLIQDLKGLMNALHVYPEEGIAPIRDFAYYERMLEDQPLIFESGIFSLFKSNKESIVEDYMKILNGLDDMIFDSPEIYRPYQEDYFSAVPLDPSQEKILRNITEHKQVIIQGPPGTGKSNSLTGIILNALENKAKVLVVCEKKTALEVIYDNLTERNLDEFCMVIDNVNSDRQRFVKAMRDRFDERRYVQASIRSMIEYGNSKVQFNEFYKRCNTKYGNLLSKVLGDLSWKDCIGNYLRAKRLSSDEQQLHWEGKKLKISAEEFFKGLNTIKEAVHLSTSLPVHKCAFDQLKDELFVRQVSTVALRELELKLVQLYHSAMLIDEQWKQWRNRLSDDDISKMINPSFVDKLILLFNKEKKQEKAVLEQLMEATSSQLSECGELFQIAQIDQNSAISLAEQNVIMCNTLSEIKECKEKLRGYFEWRHYYLSRESAFERDLLDALLEHDPDQWEQVYRRWYFNEVLLQKETELVEFPIDEKDLNNLELLDRRINVQQFEAIRDIWYRKQREVMHNRTLQSVRLSFNLRGNKSFTKRNSLRQLMHDEFELITSFFPVLLVNPSVCSSMLPLQKGLFDLVIFDEASQLRLEDTFPALIRGRFQVISGDVHQMPPSNHFSGGANAIANKALEELEEDVVFAEVESLLTYATNANFEFNYLDFHYRSLHPMLIDFSNAAFYNKRLVPMPPTSDMKPIEMREVGGIYADNTNPGEAEEILRILFDELEPDEQGVYPSVGIATFNISQQRYLWERIWDLADTNETVRQKLAGLEASGFFIKNLENVQGDQRDIIIISTTFGVRPDGKFIQNFGPINQDKGYKLLNVIVTRARKKIYLVTSIPSEFYSNYRDDIITKGNTGKGIFYAYLNYAKYCDQENETARLELLDFLMQDRKEERQETRKASNFLTESVFEEEVLERLLEIVPSSRIKTQFQLGGFRLDFVVLSELGEPSVVIECDGKTYHSSKVAYRYDLHRQKILERHGLKVYRIWSTNWWRDQEREVKKLRLYLEEEGVMELV